MGILNVSGDLLSQVVSNTTISRPDSVLGLVHAEETGGLSGKPLFNLSTQVLSDMYQLTRVILNISCFTCCLQVWILFS